MVMVEMSFEKFQDGGHGSNGRHIGHKKIATLAILNLRVKLVPCYRLKSTTGIPYSIIGCD